MYYCKLTNYESQTEVIENSSIAGLKRVLRKKKVVGSVAIFNRNDPNFSAWYKPLYHLRKSKGEYGLDTKE